MNDIQKNIVIRETSTSDYKTIVSIAKSLSAWFDEHAVKTAIPIDIKHNTCYVAVLHDTVVGFISLYVNDGKLQIGWLGVLLKYQNRGIGTQLLKKAEEYAQASGISELATYTLGDSVDYEPYVLTRKFYFKNGFTVYQRSKTDNKSCPEELKLMKKLLTDE